MREIKFRAWHLQIEGLLPCMLYDKEPGDCLRWKNEGQNIEIIMQYTGLKDKNGKEIYEADIVRFTWLIDKTYEVKWNDSTHEWQLHNREMSKYIEIIGNIYENPELLKRS